MAELHDQPKLVLFHIRAVVLHNVFVLTLLEDIDLAVKVGVIALDGQDLDGHRLLRRLMNRLVHSRIVAFPQFVLQFEDVLGVFLLLNIVSERDSGSIVNHRK